MNKDSPFLYQGGIFRQRRGMVQGRGPLRTHDLWALRSTPRSLCGAGSPCSHRCEGRCPSGASRQTWLFAPRSGGWRPPHPHEGALRPSTPGDFPVAGKVTKGAPGAAPLDLPVRSYRPFRARCASRRATFCHKPRPICHFELSGQIGLVFSSGFVKGTLSTFNPWLGKIGFEDA